jgi:hypothetical protein
VISSIKFGAYNPEDPIFRLGIGRALWVRWEDVGKGGTKPIRRSWVGSKPRDA